jgi:putative transcriptional regulator
MHFDSDENYPALLMDYAAGALPPAQALLVDVHLGLKPSARAAAAAFEVAGGLLLEALPAAPMAAAPLTNLRQGAALEPPLTPWCAESSRLIEAARFGGQGLAWRRRLFGPMEHALPLPGAKLIRFEPGAVAPRHGHTGQELTLVLTGAFADENGRYEIGDIAFADADVEHSPRVLGDAPCVCLVAQDGRSLLAPWFARATRRFFH